PKFLCLTGLVISGLLALLFLMDMIFGFTGMSALAPFKLSSLFLDIVMIVSSLILGWLSWGSLRELK
ncbi:MAG: hypothetical protein ACK53L_11980, partial [Pirellulaceae bacterium]